MSNRPAETEFSALQALLQIRTNSNADGGESSESATANDEGAATANISGSQTASVHPGNADLINLMRMSSNPVTLLQQAQVSYPPAQLAAIRAAAAAAAATLPNSTTHGGLLQLQNATFGGTGLRSPFQTSAPFAAANVATAPRSPALDLPQSPALSPLRPRGIVHVPVATVAAPGHSLPVDIRENQETESAPEKKIRKDEVEAALRSKPQRGRKRENLNAEERLELTRTRNREHAKSTR